MNLSVFEYHGQLYADSREVAIMVNKRHADLLRSIHHYIKVMEKSTERKIASSDFFIPAVYVDDTGRKLPRYDITRKGCDMIAHKLTGENAIRFTATYIERFYQMEQELSERKSPQWQTARIEGKKVRKMETEAIKEFVTYAAAQGSKNANRYYTHFSLLADKAVGITTRETASMEQLLTLRVVEMMIERAVLTEMDLETEYHKAYKNISLKVCQFMELVFTSNLKIANKKPAYRREKGSETSGIHNTNIDSYAHNRQNRRTEKSGG